MTSDARDSSSWPAALEVLRQIDRDLFSRWAPGIERALELESREIESTTAATIVVAMDSVVHCSPKVMMQHISEAFDAGASIRLLIEAIEQVSHLESGVHGIHDGLEALDHVIEEREQRVLPTPLTGAGLGAHDKVHEAPWPEPAVFPYQSPSPRVHSRVLASYHPDLWDAFREWNSARFELRLELTRRTREFLAVACDAAICWPEPLLDHHVHAAFEFGATGQEILEVVILAAASASGASESNLAGRHLPSAGLSVRHGLLALERVLSQRESKGLLAPRDRNSDRRSPAALTSADESPDAVQPSMRAVKTR